MSQHASFQQLNIVLYFKRITILTLIYHFFFFSGREYENLIMDCCQLEEGVMGVKREDAAGNDPENGSPDADRGGTHLKIFYFAPILPKK